jgi:fatty acid desaturase
MPSSDLWCPGDFRKTRYTSSIMNYAIRARTGDGGFIRWFARVHGPTWLVAITIYGSWLSLTLFHDRFPLPLLCLLGGIVVAWHGSLQHETIHGHPAGPRWLGWVLGAPPLSLWLPYGVYSETHRRHHASKHLTDPADDPEAPFELGTLVGVRGSLAHALEVSQHTALGRLLIGPLLMVGTFLVKEVLALARRAPGRRRAWALHAVSVAVLFVWLVGVARFPFWKYVLAFVYPGAGLTLLRSFAEHRPDVLVERRTTVVEAGFFFSLLFLNNNLHVVHHASPRAPWFELPRLWARERASFAARAPDLIHAGYVGIVRKWAWMPSRKIAR